MTPFFQTIWPHIRLILIILHLYAIGIRALPNTNHYRRAADWDHPSVMAELKGWSKKLDAIGWKISPLKLRRVGYSFANRYGQIYLNMVAPFRPYYRYCGTDQQWVLFSAPDRFPPRMELDIFDEGEWQVLYRPFSSHQWYGHLIESGRFRSAISRFGLDRYRHQGNRLGIYLAQRAADEFPDARMFRLRWSQRQTPSPSQVRQGKEVEWELDEQTNFVLKDYR